MFKIVYEIVWDIFPIKTKNIFNEINKLFAIIIIFA